MGKTRAEFTVALAGNPNVGKSTVFNALTGMHQHTGNWAGKTVGNAVGFCKSDTKRYRLVDIPGTYSLLAHSAEEEVARNLLCFEQPDAVVVVCDATCLERNLNLVLQIREISPRLVVCVNLMDEAKKRGIAVNLKRLQAHLSVPVVSTVARCPKTLQTLLQTLDTVVEAPLQSAVAFGYSTAAETAISTLQPTVQTVVGNRLNSRWVSLKLLENDAVLLDEITAFLGEDLRENIAIGTALQMAQMQWREKNPEPFGDAVATALLRQAAWISRDVVRHTSPKTETRDRRIDRVLTGRFTAFPLMLLLLLGIFWLTVSGANLPSAWLSEGLFSLQQPLHNLCTALGSPPWLNSLLIDGMYRVLAWVVSVMLPPMAIFFPLFTLLEDVGVLPRIAYNLDRPFKACKACGKQALTMCMGFGCNAVGVTGCRIIDSPRERLLAMLTNVFVPCNGRFPILIALITLFFVPKGGGTFRSALLLTGVILLGIGMTFLVTRLLAQTALKGTPGSFTIELPPYRKPQIGKVIVRSVFDRTLFVLGRAAAVAAPAGALIWILANVQVGDSSLLLHCTSFLDPFGRLLGLDGVIIVAFLLGFPANEIVIPLMIMAYMASGSFQEIGLEQMRALFVDNGWNTLTAVNVMLLTLFHFPCSTTVLTIKKETGSFKWTALSVLLPTAIGVLLCMLTNVLFG